MARRGAPEVRVNAVCPALVEQGFVERLAPESFGQHQLGVGEEPLDDVGERALTLEALEEGQALGAHHRDAARARLAEAPGVLSGPVQRDAVRVRLEHGHRRSPPDQLAHETLDQRGLARA